MELRRETRALSVAANISNPCRVGYVERRQARMGLLSDAVSTQFAPVVVAVVPEVIAPARVAQLAEALEGNAR